MISNRYFVCFPTLALLVIGWIVVAVSWPDGPNEHLVIGLLLGTLFGHTTFAAAWTALGPAPLILRVPASLATIALCILGLSINIRWHNQPSFGIEFVLAACLIGQWVLVQIPLWFLAFIYGMHLRHHSVAPDSRQKARQFGIRQLLIATTIVAVLLAIGRSVAANLSAVTTAEWVIFAFLAVAAVVMSLPLLLAALLPRFPIPAVAGIAALIALATLSELPLLEQVPGGGGPQTIDLIWINVVTCAWILSFALGVRLSGYGLSVPTHGATDGTSMKLLHSLEKQHEP